MAFPFHLKRLALPCCLFLPGILTIQAGHSPIPHSSFAKPETLPGPTLADRPVPAPEVGVVAQAPEAPSKPRAQARVVSQSMSDLYIHFDGLKSFMSNTYALNPTGGPVRTLDWWGSGEYKAPRCDLKTKKRSKHRGVDYVGKVRQRVVAPITGKLIKIGKGPTTGAQIVGYLHGRKHVVKLLHFDVTAPNNSFVIQGQTIGRVKSLNRWYRGMTPHVHMEIREYRGDSLLKEKNPTAVVLANQ